MTEPDKQIRDYLKTAAVETIQYIAGGNVFVTETAARLGVSLEEARTQVYQAACKLANEIHNIDSLLQR